MNNLKKIFKMKDLTKLNDKGLGTIEVILILVVLIGLVVIFKDQLLDLITRIFDAISADSGTVLT
ncbi:MAG: hypothetical protein FWE14_03690 [Lachnospiraceae bacterium]|nr:hypothetical protein [Lachnospiraceae bacterium]